MAEIKNSKCPICIKRGVCEWVSKLSALEGTSKKVGVLTVTVNDCEQFLSDENTEDDE